MPVTAAPTASPPPGPASSPTADTGEIRLHPEPHRLIAHRHAVAVRGLVVMQDQVDTVHDAWSRLHAKNPRRTLTVAASTAAAAIFALGRLDVLGPKSVLAASLAWIVGVALGCLIVVALGSTRDRIARRLHSTGVVHGYASAITVTELRSYDGPTALQLSKDPHRSF